MRGLILSLATGALFLGGCGASQQFEAVPADVNRNAVPVLSVTMTAHRYEFIPDTVRVRQGTLLKLRITSTEGTHGFKLGAFGIDERLEEGVTKDVELYAGRKGAYSFRCSHICGIGHLGMSGMLLVE
ncbi:MAG TPA: cupredoxin domain-containing protein [Bacteroidota bacterium]